MPSLALLSLLLVCLPLAWAGTFYHSTKLLYMHSVAVDGLMLIQPFNGCELGIGFYVTGNKGLVSQYGNYYLEIKADIADYTACVSFDELVHHDAKFKEITDGMGSNYNIWWTTPYVLGFSFDGVDMPWRTQQNLPTTFVNSKPNESPICVTRKTFGNQVKFNAIMPANSHLNVPFNQKLKYKGNPKVTNFCQTYLGKHTCYTKKEFKDPNKAMEFLKVDKLISTGKLKTFVAAVQNAKEEGRKPTFTQKREVQTMKAYMAKLDDLEKNLQKAIEDAKRPKPVLHKAASTGTLAPKKKAFPL